MKPLMIGIAVLFAVPALAHEGVHMHPHANDASWLPLLLSGLVAAGMSVVLWVRNK